MAEGFAEGDATALVAPLASAAPGAWAPCSLDIGARTISQDIAALTGRPQPLARAALNAVDDDQDRAYRLLMSDLALTVTDGLPCEIDCLREGAQVWLGDSDAVLSVGDFAGCSLLRVARDRREPLRLFTLEPVDVCILAQSQTPIAPGWAELEYAQYPEVGLVDGAAGFSVQLRRFDPGALTVPLESGTLLPLVRLVQKSPAAPPGNSPMPGSQSKGVRAREVGLGAIGRLPEGYRTLGSAGSGTFGTVYLSEDAGGGKVAVKCVRPDVTRNLREVEILESIAHPCVVRFLKSFEGLDPKGNEAIHIVMEYLPRNLHQRIRGKPLQERELSCFAFQIMRALAHLGSMDVCHRDVKPQNILVDGRVLKLCDFGSAKWLDGSPSISYICSRWWRAPELVLGAATYGASVDWWSGGCVVAEMMLGRPLFAGKSSWGQMISIIDVLGTPTLAELDALTAGTGSSGKIPDGHLARLAALERPGRPWEELLPAYARSPDALELPANLLAFAPDARWRPVDALRAGIFRGLLDDPAPLPVDIFDFTTEELREARPGSRGALTALRAERRRYLRRQALRAACTGVERDVAAAGTAASAAAGAAVSSMAAPASKRRRAPPSVIPDVQDIDLEVVYEGHGVGDLDGQGVAAESCEG